MADATDKVVAMPPQQGVAWADSYVNLLAGLGMPGRDKFVSQQYTFAPMSVQELEFSYRGDWIARKAVDVPAFDMTREWRAWQADPDQIQLLEATEKKLLVQQKIQQGLIKSRLYGGAAIIIGVDAGDPEEELNYDDVGKDSLKFLHVLSRNQISTGPVIYDIASKYYGQPEYYTAHNIPVSKSFQTSDPINQGFAKTQVQLHPSRVIRLIGMDTADQQLSMIWGDSVLQAVNDAIKMCGLVSGSLATLVAEMKIDVISVPELKSILSTKEGERKMIARFAAANASKSIINTILIDGNEKWQRIEANLTSAPQVLSTYLQIASGAVDIPAGRFLGLPHRGLNVTGEADFRNYYDRLSSEQVVVLTPAVTPLDEVLIRSALGQRPPEIWYEWNSLWQLSDGDKADIALKKAQAYQIDVNAAQLPPIALANGRANQLIEDGVYPGLEKALEDCAVEGDTIEEQNAPAPPPPMIPGMPPDPNAPPGGQPPPSNVSPFPPKQIGQLPPNARKSTFPGGKGAGDASTVRDFNPYHGEHGRFASGPGGSASKRSGAERIAGAIGGAVGGRIGSVLGGKLGKAGKAHGATVGGIVGAAAGRAIGRRIGKAPHQVTAPASGIEPIPPHEGGTGAVNSLPSRIKDFVTSPAAKDAILGAAQHVLEEVDDTKHGIIAGVVLATLHTFGVPPPGGLVGELVAHAAIEKLSHAIGASLPDSFSILKHSIDALKKLRGIHDAVEPDDELDAALRDFSAALDSVASQYQGTGDSRALVKLDYNPHHGPDGRFTSGPGGGGGPKKPSGGGTGGSGGGTPPPSPEGGSPHQPEWIRSLINIAGGGSGGGPYGRPINIRGRTISPELQRAAVVGGLKAARIASRVVKNQLRKRAEAKAAEAKAAQQAAKEAKKQAAKSAERRARSAKRAKREAAATAAKVAAHEERAARRAEREQVKQAQRAARVAVREARAAAKEAMKAATKRPRGRPRKVRDANPNHGPDGRFSSGGIGPARGVGHGKKIEPGKIEKAARAAVKSLVAKAARSPKAARALAKAKRAKNAVVKVAKSPVVAKGAKLAALGTLAALAPRLPPFGVKTYKKPSGLIRGRYTSTPRRKSDRRKD